MDANEMVIRWCKKSVSHIQLCLVVVQVFNMLVTEIIKKLKHIYFILRSYPSAYKGTEIINLTKVSLALHRSC